MQYRDIFLTIITSSKEGYNQNISYTSGTGGIPYPSSLSHLNELADLILKVNNYSGNYNIINTCWLSEPYEK